MIGYVTQNLTLEGYIWFLYRVTKHNLERKFNFIFDGEKKSGMHWFRNSLELRFGIARRKKSPYI